MNARLRSACICVLLSAPGPAADHYLLISKAEFAEVQRKAETLEWARAIRDELIARAGRALSRPLDFPARGGQWPHWYSCPRDGVRLKTLAPTRHQCPKCGETYSGDPYDAVVLYGVHMGLSRDARDLALAYRFTGKTEYRDRAAAILDGYAARYASYPIHAKRPEETRGGARVMAQTLDESVWLIPLAFAYGLTRDDLPADLRERVERNLFSPAAEVIGDHQLGTHNIQCWKNSAVGLAGFVTGNAELIRDAIDHPQRGFRAQIDRGVTGDGLWYEGSIGYHQYTMNALWPLAEAARNHGVDLYTDRYRSVYDAPIELALPNGDAPGFNDNAGGNLYAMGPLYELAYARWSRPEYARLAARGKRDRLEALLYGAPDLPSGPVTPERSSYLPDAGFAVLRSPTMSVAVRFGRHGGGHGHPDKLNIVTFGAGRQGGLDPGSINYGVPLHHEWYRSTIAHNTVAVDGRPQESVDGKALEWSSSGGQTSLAAEAAAYPGVVLKRSLRLDAQRLEDLFDGRSESEHTYDWAFHVPGRVSVNLELTPAEGALGADHGYQHIRLTGRAMTDESFTIRWTYPDGGLYSIRMAGAPRTEVFLGEGPGRDPAERVPLVVVRRLGRNASFRAEHTVKGAPEQRRRDLIQRDSGPERRR